MEKEQKEMSFLDHLEVLRWTLVRSAGAVLVVSVFAFMMKDFIFNRIILAPKDASFATYRFTAGIILAFPFILWEIWKFIKPGLYPKEQKNARSFIIISSFLFFVGILFGYYVITPLSVNFLGAYRVADEVKNNIDLASYIGLLRASVLSAGLIFEMPIIIFFLTKMGLVTPEYLRKYRKYTLVLVLILAALITPPDIISQVIVAIPMLILYEVSITISKIIIKKQKKTEARGL